LSALAIRVENLSKRYRLGPREPYRALREVLARAVTAPFHWFKTSTSECRNPKSDYIWALKDVSFEVRQGEVVGIIGRNGAGKTTLLKILARITKPTAGYAEIRGRVGSLLEVGTGFHPELTGRENIYLNGAILGMKKAEIDRKFDEIVAFAEIEPFLDTQVKHYSTGMYMRLAFAVAAHLEPEILLVDEVLAVGDLAFQKKCLGKMGEVAKEGRTVLFVSHNMAAVEALCRSCFLLDGGCLVATGPAREVVEQYIETSIPLPAQVVDLSHHPGRRPGALPMMQRLSLQFRSDDGLETNALPVGGDLTLTVSYVSESPLAKPVLGFVIKNQFGIRILGVNNKFSGVYPSHGPVPSGRVTCHLRACPFVEGRYTVDLWFGDPYWTYDIVDDAITFDVIASDRFGSGLVPGPDMGVLVWPADWAFQPDENI
jgi:lipopolysaccharide transport system ATP-binding protein